MSKHATVLQRQARGTATRKMMRQASAKSPGGPSAPSGAGGSPAGSVGGSPQPGRSPQKPRAPQSAPAPSDRKPVFRLLPLPNELAKLDAKLKARLRGLSMQAGGKDGGQLSRSRLSSSTSSVVSW